MFGLCLVFVRVGPPRFGLLFGQGLTSCNMQFATAIIIGINIAMVSILVLFGLVMFHIL